MKLKKAVYKPAAMLNLFQLYFNKMKIQKEVQHDKTYKQP